MDRQDSAIQGSSLASTVDLSADPVSNGSEQLVLLAQLYL